jgi:predicted nucleic acid-binding protein
VKRLVLDASAAVRLVLGLDDAPTIADLLAEADEVVAPHLFAAEVANALWKYVRAAHLQEAQALTCLEDALALATTTGDDAAIVPEALALAVRYGHPVYDALYTVLARRLACPVLTRDRRLAGLLAELRLDAC